MRTEPNGEKATGPEEAGGEVAEPESPDDRSVGADDELLASEETIRARARARFVARGRNVYIKLRNVGDVLIWLGGPISAGLRYGRRWALRAGWRRWGPGILGVLRREEPTGGDEANPEPRPEDSKERSRRSQGTED